MFIVTGAGVLEGASVGDDTGGVVSAAEAVGEGDGDVVEQAARPNTISRTTARARERMKPFFIFFLPPDKILY